MSVCVEIFHNVATDHLGRSLGFDGYRPEHAVVPVFGYTVAMTDDQKILAEAFEVFNIGTCARADSYYGLKLRSLSVGDVVKIEDRYYAVARAGFAALEREPRALVEKGR